VTRPASEPDLSLVPPNRLGALLSASRAELGLSIEEFAATRAPEFGPEELRNIELGRKALDDDQINRLMRLYGAGAGSVVPERSELVVDLSEQAVAAGGQVRPLPADASVDEVLGRYLSLLYLLRGMEPGRTLTLRSRDLAVLAGALERSITEVEQRLAELMGPAVVPWFQRLRHRLAVPAAGVAVGLSTVGGLLVIQFPAPERPTLTGTTTEVAASATLAGTATDTTLGPATAVENPDVTGDAAAAVSYIPGDPASVGAAAWTLVDFPAATVLGDWSVEFDGPRDGYRGNTNTVTRTITVYVSPTDTPTDVAGVLAHELGHAFDVMYLDGTARATWQDLRGLDGPWWPESGAADFHVGAGDFAEAFARVVADSPSDAAAGEFDAEELDFVRLVFERVGV
jgi:hypothetical protein